MSKAHERVVEAQFGPRAKAYVESAVIVRGPTSRLSGARAERRTGARSGSWRRPCLLSLARHARRYR